MNVRQKPLKPWRMGVVLVVWSLMLAAQGSGGEADRVPDHSAYREEPCVRLLQHSSAQLRRALDLRLMHGFPVTQQLNEGNARLSPLIIQRLDCEGQRIVVSGTYEFRGNLGVMDITRRGTTIIQLHLEPSVDQQAVRLENPQVLEITFDNPAPWFDGKAIRNWALKLFAAPLCANLETGQPC